MKKISVVVFLVLLWSVSTALAGGIKIGEKAPNFKLQDAQTGKIYTLDSPAFKGKILPVFYVDPDEQKTNEHVEDALLALRKRKEASGGVSNAIGLGIVNMAATRIPNMLIKPIVAAKQKKTGAVILLDPDLTIVKLWGLQNDNSDVVLLDKDRIVRYIYNGKLPPEEVKKLEALCSEYDK